MINWPPFLEKFIYFWLHWVSISLHGLSLVVASGGCSSLLCVGFSLQWLVLWRSTGSRSMGFSNWAHRLGSCNSQALGRGLRNWDAQDYLLYSMWDRPVPGIEPTYPALAGGFLSTVPPGKSHQVFIWTSKWSRKLLCSYIMVRKDSLPIRSSILFSRMGNGIW